jgi:hypothetical protein
MQLETTSKHVGKNFSWGFMFKGQELRIHMKRKTFEFHELESMAEAVIDFIEKMCDDAPDPDVLAQMLKEEWPWQDWYRYGADDAISINNADNSNFKFVELAK